MAPRFLNRLLASDKRLPADVQGALRELKSLAQERPSIAAAAGVLHDTLIGIYEDSDPVAAPAMSNEEAISKLDSGVPLLRHCHVQLDIGAFTRRWSNVCDAIRRGGDNSAARDIDRALRQGQITAKDMTDAALAGEPQRVLARADELGLDAGLTATVLRFALFPVLSQIDGQLVSLRRDYRWQYGYCPTCGSLPLLGEFRGLEQTRFLRCGLCAAAWEFPRLCCPFCGNRDHRQLGYFYDEAEEGKYRAAACENCRGLVKMVSTLGPLSPPSVLVADTATLHLDLIAAERGFHSGSPG